MPLLLDGSRDLVGRRPLIRAGWLCSIHAATTFGTKVLAAAFLILTQVGEGSSPSGSTGTDINVGSKINVWVGQVVCPAGCKPVAIGIVGSIPIPHTHIPLV